MRPPNRDSERGFTLIELMLVLLVLMILSLALWGPVQHYILRTKLKHAALQTANFITKAQIEATRNNRLVVIETTTLVGNRIRLRMFLDVHGSARNTPPDLEYEQIPPLIKGETDTIVANLDLPNNVILYDPEAVEGGTGIVGFTRRRGGSFVLAIQPAGFPETPGSYRFGFTPSGMGLSQHFLEVAVSNVALAPPTTRKYMPGSDPLNPWREHLQGNIPWDWNPRR